jgi:hypothetical protein
MLEGNYFYLLGEIIQNCELEPGFIPARLTIPETKVRMY